MHLHIDETYRDRPRTTMGQLHDMNLDSRVLKIAVSDALRDAEMQAKKCDDLITCMAEVRGQAEVQQATIDKLAEMLVAERKGNDKHDSELQHEFKAGHDMGKKEAAYHILYKLKEYRDGL